MKQTIRLVLVSVGWTGLMSLVPLEQGVGAQPLSFLASSYSSGPASVTISTRTGQVLSVLAVPPEVELSIHLIKGEFTQPNDKTGTVTFNGDVSIRTRPETSWLKGRRENR